MLKQNKEMDMDIMTAIACVTVVLVLAQTVMMAISFSKGGNWLGFPLPDLSNNQGSQCCTNRFLGYMDTLVHFGGFALATLEK